MRTVAWVRGIGKLSSAELHALDLAATTIGTPVDALAAVISFESGSTFSPSEPNRAGSGAMGLIQFMPVTMCALLGLPPNNDTKKLAAARFAAMTFTEQIAYVVKYFRRFGAKLDTLEKLYCAVFWPAAIDKPDDYVIGTVGGAVYRQNAGFDLNGNKDGKITRAEICKAVRNVLTSASSQARIEIPEPEGGDTAPFTKAERQAILDLVDRTSSEATEDFRVGGTVSDDEEEPPPTLPNS